MDYVHCDLVSLSQSTGLPYQLLTSIRRSLLAQCASLPTSAADLWQEMGTTAALLPTGIAAAGGWGEGGGGSPKAYGREGQMDNEGEKEEREGCCNTNLTLLP